MGARLARLTRSGLAAAAGCGLAIAASPAMASAASAQAHAQAARYRMSARPASLPGPKVFGWGFSDPDSISADGTHVWVANLQASTVTELDASTDALVRTIYGIASPVAISSNGT